MSPADPSRPFTSRALRGHAALDERDRPLAFETLVMPAVSAMLQTQPLVLGVEERLCVCRVGVGGKTAGFNRGDCPEGSLSLGQVASVPSPRTPSAGWSAQLEETPVSFSRSLSFCGRKHHKRLSSWRFNRDVSLCCAELTRLLALIFLVSTLLSAVIFLMFS